MKREHMTTNRVLLIIVLYHVVVNIIDNVLKALR